MPRHWRKPRLKILPDLPRKDSIWTIMIRDFHDISGRILIIFSAFGLLYCLGRILYHALVIS